MTKLLPVTVRRLKPSLTLDPEFLREGSAMIEDPSHSRRSGCGHGRYLPSATGRKTSTWWMLAAGGVALLGMMLRKKHRLAYSQRYRGRQEIPGASGGCG